MAATAAAGVPALLLNGGPDLTRITRAAGRDDLSSCIATELASIPTVTSSPVVAALATWTSAAVAGDAPAVPEAAAVLAAVAGDRARARRLALAAHTTYGDLGATWWRRQLLTQLAAAGITLRPRRPTTTAKRLGQPHPV